MQKVTDAYMSAHIYAAPSIYSPLGHMLITHLLYEMTAFSHTFQPFTSSISYYIRKKPLFSLSPYKRTDNVGPQKTDVIKGRRSAAYWNIHYTNKTIMRSTLFVIATAIVCLSSAVFAAPRPDDFIDIDNPVDEVF